MASNEFDNLTLEDLDALEQAMNEVEGESQYSAEAGYPQSSLTAGKEPSLTSKILPFIPGVGPIYNVASGDKPMRSPEGFMAALTAGLDVMPFMKVFKGVSPSISASRKALDMMAKEFDRTALKPTKGAFQSGVKKAEGNIPKAETGWTGEPGWKDIPEGTWTDILDPRQKAQRLGKKISAEPRIPTSKPQIAAEAGWEDIPGPGWQKIPGGLPKVKGYLAPPSTRLPSTTEQLRRGVGFRENLRLVTDILSMKEGL